MRADKEHIGKVVVNFNQTPSPTKPENKLKAKNNFKRSKGNTLVNFATKAKVVDNHFTNLRNIFVNQALIEKYALSYLRDNPDVGFDNLKEAVDVFIKRKGIKVKHFSTINNAIRNFYKLMDKGKTLREKDIYFLMFNESNINNGRFTLTYRRDKLMIDYLNIVIQLEDKLPSSFPDDTFFHLNISCTNPETLEGLQVTFQLPR